MNAAYVDSSAIVAIAFEELGWPEVEQRLGQFDDLWSSNLLEAEIRAAYRREQREFRPEILMGVRWVIPDRRLTREISMVVGSGYVKGADLWHLATALYAADDPGELTFITLDERQAEVARALGFRE